MILGARLSLSVVYNFWFWYCAEVLSGYHEVTDNFYEVSDLNPYLPKEYISVPYPNDHYFLWIYPCQEEIHGKSWLEGVGAYLFLWEPKALFPKVECFGYQRFGCHLRCYCCFLFSTHTVFTGVSSDVPGYESSLEMILAHIYTRHRRFPVYHWVTVALLTPFFCVLKFGDTLSDRCMWTMLCMSLKNFL